MSANIPSDTPVQPIAGSANRWVQLWMGVLCMAAASNIQYAWTLFVDPIQTQFGWSRADIQYAFFLFVVVQTWSTPLLGHFIDRYGPRPLVLIGGLFTGFAWVLNSQADSLAQLYVGSVVGGIGVGAVYATCINNAMKWFPDKRGLAVGLTAGGYGSGTILTILPIQAMIRDSGYQSAFFTFGLIQGLVLFTMSWFLRAPSKPLEVYSTKVLQTRRDFTVFEAMGTPVFWVLLIMFTCTVTGGLMAVAQLAPMARDYGVADMEMNFVFFAMPALGFALMMDRVMNGVSRPLFGWISDRLGRENTMFIAFSLEACGIAALATFGSNPWAFILLSGVVFLAWGEVYSLFSATAGDTFGTRHIGKIYGVLYCAKGIAAFLVPFGNKLAEATGTWATVLYSMAALDVIAALAAILVLRPLLRRHHRKLAEIS